MCSYLREEQVAPFEGFTAREEAQFAKTFDLYVETLRSHDAVDFDDLLGLTVALLERHEAVLQAFHQRYRHILVDEFQVCFVEGGGGSETGRGWLVSLLVPHATICSAASTSRASVVLLHIAGCGPDLTAQAAGTATAAVCQLVPRPAPGCLQDTNGPQYQLVSLLYGPSCSLFTVGDPNQSIYGWRGAEVANLHTHFEQDFEEHATYNLVTNYRWGRGLERACHCVLLLGCCCGGGVPAGAAE